MRIFKRQETIARPLLAQFTHSIRFRLVLWFVLILAVVMLIFSSFVYWRQAQDTRTIALSRLNFLEERLLGPQHEGESESETPLTSLAPPGNFQSVNLNLLEDNIVAFQTPGGVIVQSAGVLSDQQLSQLNLPSAGWDGVRQVKVPKSGVLESSHYLFIKPAILQDGRVSGYLLLGVPSDPNNQMERLLVSLIIGNLLTLGIALVGGFWLADRAMHPVHTITHTAQQISETDLNKRLHMAGKDELSELGNTFDAMLDRLQAAFERQRQFTADASHELRTPLTIIDLESRRGLSNRRSADEQEKILHTIQSENQLMIRMVNNLLVLARMDAGQITLQTNLMDLGDVTLEVFERLLPLASSQGVNLSIDDLPDILVLGDRAMLIQMLTNLVENAVKYSASVAHPQVHISAGLREANGEPQAWVRVEDNGIGIPMEHQEHIFDRFYQVEASRSRSNGAGSETIGKESSGTGLGLAIAQWIARAHHGDIRVESAASQGTTFEVVLPAYHQVR